MLTQLFTEAAARLLQFSAPARAVAEATSLMVETLVDNGFGSAVLVDSHLVLTAAHNFDACRPQKSIIHRPSTGEKSSVRTAKFYPNLDLAVVTLTNSFAGPFAAIDDATTPKRGLPLMMPRFFSARHTASLKSKSGFHFTHSILKGLLIDPEETIEYREGSREQLVSLMHLKSVTGDSGAGIFSEEGALITILNTGNGYGASGCHIPTFRNVVRHHNLKTLSGG